MKKIIFTSIVLLLSCRIVYGQISTAEEPVSFRTANIPALRTNDRTAKSMPSFDIERIQAEDREEESKGRPPRFGYRQEVNYNLDNSGEWTTLPDGSRIWRLAISSPGALSINLLYDKFWIPDGAKFFIIKSKGFGQICPKPFLFPIFAGDPNLLPIPASGIYST
jgi:hypothetical protein